MSSPSELEKAKAEEDYQFRREQAVIEAQRMEREGGRVRWKHIEEKYHVKKGSIKYFVKNKKKPRTRGQACKARAKTLPEEDSVLEEYLLRENYKGNFPSRDAFLETANDLVRRRQVREKQPSEELTRDWVVNWLRRYRSISTQRIRAIQKALLDGYSRENCEQYFKSLEKASKEVYEDLIDNVDETGFSIGDTSKM